MGGQSPERLQQVAEGFVQGFVQALDTAAVTDPALRPFAEGLRKIPTAGPARVPPSAGPYPALAHIPAMRATARRDAFTESGFAAADAMTWLPVVQGEGIDQALATGMYAAQAVGTYGCFDSQDVAAGLFLIGPGVNYPLHTHQAAEVYWCLGGSIALRHGIEGEPFTLRGGEYSVTPPNRAHGLVTAEEPVLLAYLWVGDLTAPIWWWDEPEPGTWRRTEWRRLPGKSWGPVRAESVTPAIMAAAHG